VWLVIDTNQARRIPEALRPGRITERAAGLSLPPYLLAEVLQRGVGPRGDTVSRLTAHPVRFGVEPMSVFDMVARLNANQIPRLKPFASPGSPLAQRYGQLLDVAPTAGEEAANWADRLMLDNQRIAARLSEQSRLARLRAKREGVTRATTFPDVLDELSEGPDSFLVWWV
jgi:hypothetical protein